MKLLRISAMALLCGALAAANHSQAAGIGQRAQRIAKIQEAVAPVVAKLDKRLAAPAAEPVIRDLANAALAKLIISNDGPGAESLLRLEFAQQNMDAHSPDFGNLPWQIGHPDIHDANAIEFGMQPIGPIWLGHGRQLSPAFKAEMLPHLRAALAAIHRHQVKVTYTNIFLMKTVNLILLGEAIGDKDAAAEGYSQLDQWIAWTRQAGISEYDSPTYYSVDLNSLAMGYRYSARAETRAKFKAILDYIWRDIAANYFAPRHSLSGPHSRDYDFLNGTGDLDIYLYVEALQPSLDMKYINLEKALLLDGVTSYQPDSDILNSAHIPQKLVIQSYDAGPAAWRYNYITPDFAIGCADGDHGPQDKLFSLELTGSNSQPVISVVPDTTDQPYGLAKVKAKDGHEKPVHLSLHLTAVQQKGVALLLLDLDPQKEEPSGTLATNVILPANTDKLVFDGRQVSATPNLSEAGRMGSIVGIRMGGAAVAIRLLSADGCAGQQPAVELKADAVGLAHQAMRLAIYHYQGSPRAFDEQHVRVALLIAAGHCENEAGFESLLDKIGKASVEQETVNGVWTVRVGLTALKLEAAHDLSRRLTLARKVNGVPETAQAPLTLNGKPIVLGKGAD